MRTYTLMAPCHFGTESVAKREIYDLGYEVTEVSDGRIFFEADEEGIVLANLMLRSVERILLVTGRFKATTFDELFEGIKAISWEDYIPGDGRFWVKKATSVKSKLFSSSDIQSITKKAMVDRLAIHYNISVFPETGDDYPVRMTLNKDEVVVGLDTSGDSLHKRGYRAMSGGAPISETLAAALIKLTPWKKGRILVDPFCGSGTFLIEAAMMAADIAPGLSRSFTCEKWTKLIDPLLFREARREAREAINTDIDVDLQGYDIDPKVLRIARENAREAGVDGMIHFQERDVSRLSHPKPYGFIITNPPYGMRMGETGEVEELYRKLGKAYEGLKDWSMFVITSYSDAQKAIGRKADRNRKIYNGMLKTYFYQYMGSKPPKRMEKNNSQEI